VPDLVSDQSIKILAVFQGKASLSATVKQTAFGASSAQFTELTTVIAATSAVRVSLSKPTATSTTTSTSTTTTTTTTIPSVVIEQVTKGIVPPNDPTCQF